MRMDVVKNFLYSFVNRLSVYVRCMCVVCVLYVCCVCVVYVFICVCVYVCVCAIYMWVGVPVCNMKGKSSKYQVQRTLSLQSCFDRWNI